MTIEVLVARSAWDAIQAAAGIDPMRETGGVLLGWRHEGGVFVTDALVVRDARARHTLYRRRHKPAADVLAAVLAALPDDSPVGYVGEWHSHSAPVGPSWVDRREMRRISKQRECAVALLIAAYQARATTWSPVGLIARGGRTKQADVALRDDADQ